MPFKLRSSLARASVAPANLIEASGYALSAATLSLNPRTATAVICVTKSRSELLGAGGLRIS